MWQERPRCIGLQDNEPGLNTRRITLQEINFCGTYCYRRDNFAEALTLLSGGVINGAGWAEIRALDDGVGAARYGQGIVLAVLCWSVGVCCADALPGDGLH